MRKDGKRLQRNETARFAHRLELDMYRSGMHQFQVPSIILPFRKEPIKCTSDLFVKRQIAGCRETEEPQQIIAIAMGMGEAEKTFVFAYAQISIEQEIGRASHGFLDPWVR